METQKVNATKSESFSCPLGTELILRVEAGGVQLKGSLVGMDRNNFLILKIPLTVEVNALMKDNVSVKGLFMFEGTIFGFISKILSTIDSPDLLLFLSYPDVMEKHELRKNMRIQCSIPATIHKSGKEDYTGIITDLSTEGCRVTLSGNTRQLPANVEIDGVFKLSCDMFGITTDHMVQCIIKNYNRDDRIMHMGFEFNKAELDVLEQIHSYIERVIGVIA